MQSNRAYIITPDLILYQDGDHKIRVHALDVVYTLEFFLNPNPPLSQAGAYNITVYKGDQFIGTWVNFQFSDKDFLGKALLILEIISRSKDEIDPHHRWFYLPSMLAWLDDPDRSILESLLSE